MLRLSYSLRRYSPSRLWFYTHPRHRICPLYYRIAFDLLEPSRLVCRHGTSAETLHVCSCTLWLKLPIILGQQSLSPNWLITSSSYFLLSYLHLQGKLNERSWIPHVFKHCNEEVRIEGWMVRCIAAECRMCIWNTPSAVHDGEAKYLCCCWSHCRQEAWEAQPPRAPHHRHLHTPRSTTCTEECIASPGTINMVLWHLPYLEHASADIYAGMFDTGEGCNIEVLLWR